MNRLVLHSNDALYDRVVEYIYESFKHSIHEFCYKEGIQPKRFYWRNINENENEVNHDLKFIHPYECFIEDTYKGNDIKIEIKQIKDQSGNINTIYYQEQACHGGTDILLKELILTMENKDDLLQFVDDSKDFFQKKTEENQNKTNDTIRIYYFKEYWSLLSKNPKRSLDTIYMKKGEKEKLVENIQTFLKEETRKDYLYYGIPYKCVYMLYGPPGTGKTCTVNALASHFNCDIYTIPITKELKDIQLIEALSYFSGKEDEKKIIMIEDIDCTFVDRKSGDENNQITLQNLLNCFDGFTCIEGTLLFITANNPEILDDALIRSCRIDRKIEFTHADKYQTQSMFEKYFPKQLSSFDKFYKKICHIKYSIAMLQEFMFFNRHSDDILKEISQFMNIVDKNKRSEFKKSDKNLYM